MNEILKIQSFLITVLKLLLMVSVKFTVLDSWYFSPSEQNISQQKSSRTTRKNEVNPVDSSDNTEYMYISICIDTYIYTCVCCYYILVVKIPEKKEIHLENFQIKSP